MPETEKRPSPFHAAMTSRARRIVRACPEKASRLVRDTHRFTIVPRDSGPGDVLSRAGINDELVTNIDEQGDLNNGTTLDSSGLGAP